MSTSTDTPVNAHRRRGAFGTLFAALGAALQWRMLLWWLAALAVPTAIAALPIVRGLMTQFGESPAAAAIARGGELPLLIDGLFGMRDIAPMLSTGVLVATLIALLLSPWLSGMVVASIRAARPLDLGELARGGLAEYWRMARMMLWSLLVFAIAARVGGMVSDALGERADAAILASDADRQTMIGTVVAVVLLAFAHMTLDAGRGWLAADPTRRSVVRAWGNGMRLVLRRPVASLVLYGGVAVVCYALALLFGWLRLHIAIDGGDGATAGGFALGLLLSQAVVAMIAWARIARLYGFATLAREAAVSRIADAAEPHDVATHRPDATARDPLAPLPPAHA